MHHHITHQADLTLGGHTFTGAINPYMKLSLLSEGDLYVNEGWKFDSEDGHKRVTPPTNTGMPFLADMMGVLAFWPQKDLVEAIGEAPEMAYSLYTKEEVQMHQNKQTSISDFFPKVERENGQPTGGGITRGRNSGSYSTEPSCRYIPKPRSNRGRGTELQPADCRQRYVMATPH